MNRDIIKELSKWIYNYRACVENHAGCDVFIIPYDNTENTAEELYIKHIKPYQNQKAIECLKEVKKDFISGILIFDTDSDLTEREQDKILEHYKEDKRILADIINTKIKELEEKENGNNKIK